MSLAPRVTVLEETLQGRLSGLPDGVLVERDPIGLLGPDGEADVLESVFQ